MDKKTVLDYIVGQGKRVTAKVVSIDLDAPISTTTELLERMTHQGLLARDRDQRPREYAITEEGRNRLAFFKARDAAETPPGEHNPDGNPGASASGAAPTNPASNGAGSTEKLDALREDVCSRLDALREDMRDLLDVLAAKPSSGAPAPAQPIGSRVQALLARANRLVQRDDKSPEKADPKIAALYQARKKADSLPFFSHGERRTLRDTIENLEAELGPETSESIERLVDLESRHSPEIEEIARLRAALGVESHDPALAEVVA